MRSNLVYIIEKIRQSRQALIDHDFLTGLSNFALLVAFIFQKWMKLTLRMIKPISSLTKKHHCGSIFSAALDSQRIPYLTLA
jgi:hypothetical protein